MTANENLHDLLYPPMERKTTVSDCRLAPAGYRSPAQKWGEAVKLRELAWNLKRASIKQAHPEWSEKEIEKAVKEIFLNATT